MEQPWNLSLRSPGLGGCCCASSAVLPSWHTQPHLWGSGGEPTGPGCASTAEQSPAQDLMAAPALAAIFLLRNQIYSCFKRLDILINYALQLSWETSELSAGLKYFKQSFFALSQFRACRNISKRVHLDALQCMNCGARKSNILLLCSLCAVGKILKFRCAEISRGMQTFISWVICMVLNLK